MLKLPKIPYVMEKDKQQTIAMGSINYSKMTQDGDVADSSGISGRYFPYITTAKGDSQVATTDNCVSATIFDGEWAQVNKAGALYYDGKLVGQLEPGEKQFAAINTKLVIMPDKKYLDISGGKPVLKDMGAKVFVGATIYKSSILNKGHRVFGWVEGSTFEAASPEDGLNFSGDYRMLIESKNEYKYVKALLRACTVQIHRCTDASNICVFLAGYEVEILRTLNDVWIYNKKTKKYVETSISSLKKNEEENSFITDYQDGSGYYDIETENFLPGVTEGAEMHIFALYTDMEYHPCMVDNAFNCRIIIPDAGIDKLIGINEEIDNPGWYFTDEGNPSVEEGIYEGKIYNGADDSVDFVKMFGDNKNILVSFDYGDSSIQRKQFEWYNVEASLFTCTVPIIYDPGKKYYGVMDIMIGNDSAFQVFNRGDAVTVTGAKEENNNITFVIDGFSPDYTQIYANSEIFDSDSSENESISNRSFHALRLCDHEDN